ncbi:ROK family protein [Novosphingobium malaysiense]|uniref:fructokinase n=1 Tax=Novosphingobium malaysiense TaxID=1348853 RepID=A0A0B1ZQB0_9SPHN|nr:ROK family protein [Novosphingobium malaysiense]KHK93315.1 fructokinase [Novosphingobium malaysiense]
MSKNFAGIELGGTKTIVVQGRPGLIRDRLEFPTTTPDETLSRAIEAIELWQRQDALQAVGVASFGPIRVARDVPDYGTMLDTPKSGWSGARIVQPLADALRLPVALDTDVHGAGVAEWRLGAARNCRVIVYLTIGTGLGGGVLVDGEPVHGMLHPEIGHVRLRRLAGDRFAGACRFHGDCMEGLLSGPALEARFGRHPSRVDAADPAWTPVVHDLAELLAALVLTLSPQRIVVGGGVANKQPHLLPAALCRLPEILGGYLRDFTPEVLAGMITPPAMGDNAGPMGALILAERAAAE